MPSTRTTVLVGREPHLRELQHLVEGIAASRGYSVALSGEAGAGKTRLAEEAAALAETAGLRVAWATCWRNAAGPMSVWTDLLASVGADAGALPEQPAAGVDPEGARALWARALARHFRDLLAEPPTLLVVDDLQWSDPLSLHTIEVFLALLRSCPLGLLGTVRDDPSAPNERLERLVASGRHLVVPPLTKEELGELAIELTGRKLPPTAVARLHDRTAGNVLFARELLDEAGADLDEPARQVSSAGASTIFTERFDALRAQCRRALETASVIGRRFRLDVLAEALGVDAEELLEFLSDAERAGLVRAGSLGTCEFSHPLMAEACYAAGGMPRRVRLHRDVAEAMERLRRRGVTIAAVEIAQHFASAAAAGAADKAVEYAAIAGRDDMDQLAYEDAVRDFTVALRAHELCPADDALRADLLLGLADALAATGDRPAAREAYERVVGLARQNGRHELLARAALGVGSGPGGFEVPPFDDRQIAVLEEAASTSTGVLRARVLARLSVALALDPRAVARRGELSREAIELAREADDPAALGYALASWCDVIPGPDAVEDRLAATAEILPCATAVNDTGLELLGRRLRVLALLEAGRIDDVDAEITAYARSAERLGQAMYTWYVPLWQAMRATMDGRLDVAEGLRATAAELGEQAHSDNALMLTKSQRAMLLCELRDSAEAAEFFRDIQGEYPDYAIMTKPALAYALAASGDLIAAREILASVDVAAHRVETLGSELLTTLAMLATGAWLCGFTPIAADLYEALRPHRDVFAVDGIGAYLVGSVERSLGVLAALREDTDTARRHFEIAHEHHTRVRSALLVAASLRDAGSALGDRAMLDDARARFLALGFTEESAAIATSTPFDAGVAPTRNVFRRDGDMWLVAVDGDTVHVRHTKGMADLARLLARPGQEVHVLDLVESGPTLDSGSTGDALDDTARRQYGARLVEIDGELADADENGDIGRSEQLSRERDALLAELGSAYGLGGRARRQGDSAERARSAVTQRIRDAIARIDRSHHGLAEHLRRSVRTGTFCVYEPERPTEWDL